MSDARWQRIQNLFEQALPKAPAERSAFLRHECAQDAALRTEVEELLAHDGQASDDFLTPPPIVAFAPDPAPTQNADPLLAMGGRPTIAGYEILRELHRGGQGIVYEAHDRVTKRKVAIKILLESLFDSRYGRRRFEREIELAASLKHPNIVSVFHSGQTQDGRQFCVMDYVRGVPLQQYVRERRLPMEEVLKLFSTVCAAVSYAHQKGVIHRDLKPSNILVDTEGVPRVLDFGLAKQVGGPEDTVVSITGQVVGTLPYMSPEQARGNPDEIDTRTDVYALGVILYEMLTGQYPYPVVGQMAEILRNITETPPTPPSRRWTAGSGVTQRNGKRHRTVHCPIDQDVETIVLRSLAKERERRYQSAGELSRDIALYLSGEPIEARRDSRIYLIRKSLAHYKGRLAVAAIALFFLSAATVLAVREHRQRRADTCAAQANAIIDSRPKPNSELDRAEDLLNEAFRNNPDHADTYLIRGRLSSLRTLRASREQRSGYVEQAISDFLRAHEARGGRIVPGAKDLARVARGCPEALEAASILSHLVGRDDEARQYIRRAKNAARTEVRPFYDRMTDGLVVPNLAILGHSPELDLSVADFSATLRRGLVLPVKSLWPRISPTQDDYVTALIFDPLVFKGADGEPILNDLVVSRADFNPDGPSVIHLRPGLTWQDGQDLTANDVVFSLSYFLSLKARAVTPLEVAVDTNGIRLQNLARVQLLPAHLLEGTPEEEWDTKPVVGSGPYTLGGRPRSSGAERAKWDEKIILRRWDGYSQRPYFASIEFVIIRDQKMRLSALQRGELDELELSAEEFSWHVNGESFNDVRKLFQPSNTYEYLGWNAKNPIFADKNIRRALTLGLNIERVRTNWFGGLCEECLGIYRGDSPTFNAKVTPIRFDPPEAQRLLNEAGWAWPTGSPVRVKDGVAFEFTLLVPEESRGAQSAVVALAEDLAALGIKMTIELVTFEELKERRRARDFDAYWGALQAALRPEQEQDRWRSGTVPNDCSYSNTRVDELLAQARQEKQADKRGDCFREIHKLVYDDQPVTFLWFRPTLHALNPRLRGIVCSQQSLYRFYPGPRAWWMPVENSEASR